MPLYLTIWIALALFAAGELGRARRPDRAGWAWVASSAGLALALVHTVLAFAVVHGWSHEAAIRATAVQTESVFGRAVGSGIYANYLFFAVWAADLFAWRASGSVTHRPRAWTIILRTLYLIIVLNAAIIFAVGWRRALGLIIVLTLLAAWLTPRRAMSVGL